MRYRPFLKLVGWTALLVLLAVLLMNPRGFAQSTVLNFFSQPQGTSQDNPLTINGSVTREGLPLPAIQSGTGTLDGLNPTFVNLQFTVGTLNCVVVQKGNAAPADDPDYLTIAATNGMSYFEVYAWKNTGGTDPTLVASTNNATDFDWICTGN